MLLIWATAYIHVCAVQPGAIRLIQGGHKPGKLGKPGKLREFEKL